jgi:hypothetical protein
VALRPIAVGVTGDGVLLVLEQDNQRIQAFDVYGNPVPYFPNNSPFAPLQTERRLSPIST